MILKGNARTASFRKATALVASSSSLTAEMDPARAAVDSHIQKALAALAVGGLQLGQVLDVHVHEAEIIVLERAALPFALLRRGQAAQPLSLEDAVDRIAVEMRQEVRDDEGQVIERKAGGLAQGADDRPLLIRGFPGQLVRPAAMVLAVLCTALAPFADGLGAHAEALGQHAGGLGGAGNLLADGRGGAGLGMKGVHQILHQARGGRREPSKRQVYSSIAQRTRSQQRSATRQLVVDDKSRS